LILSLVRKRGETVRFSAFTFVLIILLLSGNSLAEDLPKTPNTSFNRERFETVYSGVEMVISFIDAVVDNKGCEGGVLSGGVGGDGTQSRNVQDFQAGVCAYSLVAGTYLHYFAKYIAAPGFVCLLFFFLGEYVYKVYRNDETGGKYWVSRLLIILLASTLVFPANKVIPGETEDTRPYGLYLALKGVRASLELGGLVANVVLQGYWKAADLTGVNGDGQELRTESYLRNLVAHEDDPLVVLFHLPISFFGIFERESNILLERAEKVANEVKNNPELETGFRQAQKEATEKEGLWGSLKNGFFDALKSAGSAVLGVSALGVGAATVTAVPSAGLGLLLSGGLWTLASVSPKIANFVLHMLSSVVSAAAALSFAGTVIIGFYGALFLHIFRAMLWLMYAPAIALLSPLGRWGVDRAKSLGFGLLQILLTPLVIVGLYFLVLLVRALWVGPFQTIILALIDLLTWGSSLGMIIIFGFYFMIPTLMGLALAMSFFKVPSYLSYWLGTQVFRTDAHSHQQIRVLGIR